MNADDPPIAADKSLMGCTVAIRGAADKGLMNCIMEIRGAAGFLAIATNHVFIGGNRRVIGVHRREPPC